MKKILVIAIVFLNTVGIFAQTFEGKIVYQNTVKSKVKEVTDQQWIALLGSEQEYFIKKGNYKSISNGTMFQWQLYLNNENKIYNKLAASNSAFWLDASQAAETITKIEVVTNAAEVLGYSCNVVVITTPTATEKYYFNSKFAVDPTVFVDHKYGNWSEFVAQSKALPLKTVIDNSQFLLESEAKSIKASKISDDFFELPAGIQITKSPY